MTFNFLISLCNPISIEGPEPDRIGGIAHDSRSVDHDYVFVAVKGYQTDGHQFIDQAIENGAQTIIHDQEISGRKKDICYVKVEETRTLLGHLAQAYYDYPGDRLKITGITGTNGKTTVATLVYQALKKLKERPSLLGTNENIIDGKELDSELTTSDPVELAQNMYAMVKAGSNHLVMEVSSHALQQKRTEGIPFSIAAFTNISHDHLDYHGSMDQYADAKKRLFTGLPEEALAIINTDDSYAETMIKDCNAEILSFGFQSEADVSCRILSHDLSGLRLEVDDTQLTTPLCGKFNAYNLAQAFLILNAYGHEKKAAANALSTCKGPEGRLQRLNEPTLPQPTVYVDYAHTPHALENVLETLQHLKLGDQKLYLVFGCGGERDRDKRSRMAEIAESYADEIMVTSDNPRSESPEKIVDDIYEGFSSTDHVQRTSDRKAAIQQVIRQAEPHAIILIAGKGHETYQIIDGQQFDFDDREIALETLESEANARNGEVV